MKINKKIIALVVCIVIVIVGGIIISRSQNDKTIKIGVISPLTGPAASIGEWMVQGVQFSADEINNTGGIHGKKIELVIEDDKCEGKTGVNAYQKLHSDNKIDYFIGPLCSASRIPVLQSAENDKTVLITTGLSLKTAPDTKAYTFNVLPSIWSVMEKTMEFGLENGYKKISLLYVDDEYGKENYLAAKDFADSHEITILTEEKFTRGTADLRTQILKAKNDGSQAVVIAGYGPDFAVFLKQAKELDLKKPFLATSNIQVPEAVAMSKQTGQTVFYSYPAVSNFQSVIDFANKFKKAHPDASGILPMYIGSGYDALTLLGKALIHCDPKDSTCVERSLMATQSYEGANGLITFDDKGNNSAGSSIEIRIMQNGEFKQYQK